MPSKRKSFFKKGSSYVKCTVVKWLLEVRERETEIGVIEPVGEIERFWSSGDEALHVESRPILKILFINWNAFSKMYKNMGFKIGLSIWIHSYELWDDWILDEN